MLTKHNIYFQLFAGFLNVVSEATSNILSPLNTFATNFLQCWEEGHAFIYSPLDFERKTTIPVERTTEAVVEIRRSSGK